MLESFHIPMHNSKLVLRNLPQNMNPVNDTCAVEPSTRTHSMRLVNGHALAHASTFGIQREVPLVFDRPIDSSKGFEVAGSADAAHADMISELVDWIECHPHHQITALVDDGCGGHAAKTHTIIELVDSMFSAHIDLGSRWIAVHDELLGIFKLLEAGNTVASCGRFTAVRFAQPIDDTRLRLRVSWAHRHAAIQEGPIIDPQHIKTTTEAILAPSFFPGAADQDLRSRIRTRTRTRSNESPQALQSQALASRSRTTSPTRPHSQSDSEYEPAAGHHARHNHPRIGLMTLKPRHSLPVDEMESTIGLLSRKVANVRVSELKREAGPGPGPKAEQSSAMAGGAAVKKSAASEPLLFPVAATLASLAQKADEWDAPGSSSQAQFVDIVAPSTEPVSVVDAKPAICMHVGFYARDGVIPCYFESDRESASDEGSSGD